MTTDSSTKPSDIDREPIDGPADDLELTPEKVVVTLLRQQQTLLTELSWAYEQLERSQESEIAALRSRVSSLEYRVAKKSKGRGQAGDGQQSSPPSFLAGTRKRVDFTIRHPRMALRAAERHLRRQNSSAPADAGLTK